VVSGPHAGGGSQYDPHFFGCRDHRRPTGILSGAIAALALGVLQAVAIVFLPSGWQDAIVFSVLFLVIVVRPKGVFGIALRW